jgi:uncharacterized SAM-binding protein YcdF (DUF218 family)
MPWDKARRTEGDVLREYAILNGIPSEKIFILKDEENTTDKAVAVKDLIKSSSKIILVTSAFHIYRSKRLFEKQGIEVNAFKIDYETAGGNDTVVMDFLPYAVSLKLIENGFREIIGRLFIY